MSEFWTDIYSIVTHSLVSESTHYIVIALHFFFKWLAVMRMRSHTASQVRCLFRQKIVCFHTFVICLMGIIFLNVCLFFLTTNKILSMLMRSDPMRLDVLTIARSFNRCPYFRCSRTHRVHFLHGPANMVYYEIRNFEFGIRN